MSLFQRLSSWPVAAAVVFNVHAVQPKPQETQPYVPLDIHSTGLTSAQEKEITKQFVSRLPRLTAPKLQSSIRYDMDDLTKDRALIRLAEKNMPSVQEGLKKAREENEEHLYALNRHQAYMILSLALRGTFASNESKRLQKQVERRFGGANYDPVFRSNCYAYALGDIFSNQFFLAADPGDKVYGFSYQMPMLDSINVVVGAVDDGLVSAGRNPQQINIPKGKRVVALYIHENEKEFDFHWTRLDRRPDGKLQVSMKYGMESFTRHYTVDNIYDEMRRNFTNNRDDGYNFVGFFLVDEKGLDVGLDAFLRRQKKTPFAGTDFKIPLSRKTYDKNNDAVFYFLAQRGSEEKERRDSLRQEQKKICQILGEQCTP